MDARPVAWRLEGQDYAAHKFGRPPPPSQRRQFGHRDAALAELDRLRAVDGAEVVGAIVPVMPKLASVQSDFGFPGRRPAPNDALSPKQKGRRHTKGAPAKLKGLTNAE